MKTLYLVLVSAALATCKPASGDGDVLGSVIGAVKSCGEKDVSLCLKVCGSSASSDVIYSVEYSS